MFDCGIHFERVTLVTMHEVNRPWLFQQMKNSLQLLACPPKIQLGQFPEFVHTPDELTLGFDDFRRALVGNFRTELTGEQLSCLDSIDRSLSQMPKGYFSPDAVTNSPQWQQIRQLAAEALKAFGWPLEIPHRRDDEFVPG